jgi:hypothetical protein
MYLKILFLFFIVLIVTQLYAVLISGIANQAITAVQGKPIDMENFDVLLKVSLGSLIATASLTLLLFFVLPLDYLSIFCIGLAVSAFAEGSYYANFEKWPFSIVLVDSIGVALSFILIKRIYHFRY